jgi:hypothetical protein
LRSQSAVPRPAILVATWDLVSLLLPRKPSADDGLGAALGLAFGRYRIDFRRIEHVDAAVDRTIHLRVTFGFGVLLAEGHSAEAELAHLQPGAAKLAITHFFTYPGPWVQPSARFNPK